MIEKANLENILFLDIETVPEHENYDALDLEMQALWEAKSQYQRKEQFTADEFYDRAGIWAEFGEDRLYFRGLLYIQRRHPPF